MTSLQMVLGDYWITCMGDTDDSNHNESSPETDLVHINSALNGDEDAFARLVENYQPIIARMMWKFTRSEVFHRELTQEVFVKAYFNLKSYRGEAPFEHWLRRIAIRTGYEFWRKRTKEENKIETIQEEWAVLNQEDQSPIDPEAAGLLLQNLLQQLSPRNRILLTLLYWENNSVAEAADLLGWSRSMVKVQAFRACAKLRELLKGIKK